jgi:tetratricopeptide (TPR) repeat protein
MRRTGYAVGEISLAAPAETRTRLLRDVQEAQAAGKLQDAEALCRKLLALAPDFVPGLQVLAEIGEQTGRSAVAVQCLREAIRIDRKSAPLRCRLAAVLRRQGSLPEAIALGRQALRLEPKDAGALAELGISYLAAGKCDEAVTFFRQAIKQDPTQAAARYHLAKALQQKGYELDAIVEFQRVVEIAPDYAEPKLLLAELLFSHGRRREAIACLRAAMLQDGTAAESWTNLADALMQEAELDEAETCIRHAIALDPNSPVAHYRLGLLLSQRGQFTDAIASFRRALLLQPQHAGCYLGIVSAKAVTASDAAILSQMRTLLSTATLTETDQATLHYALGKACDDLASYADAMEHFRAANQINLGRLHRAGRALDRVRHEADITRLTTMFTPAFFERHSAFGSCDERPVFIVGMIRSGTTLVEQIVSSHPEIAAGGELHFWGRHGSLHTALEAGQFDAEAARQIVAGYQGLLRSISPEARRITDKMPTNFLLLGMIHLMFPQARIIHCQRHPIDTCLSIYVTPYRNLPDFAHDRETISFYYKQYLRLMEHWRRVLPPDRFFDLRYEDLVSQREAVTRRLIAFCGVEWHDACLRPELNDRVITTPSNWQSRQPVYRRAVQRWRNYEPWLGAFGQLTGDEGVSAGAVPG